MLGPISKNLSLNSDYEPRWWLVGVERNLFSVYKLKAFISLISYINIRFSRKCDILSIERFNAVNPAVISVLTSLPRYPV